MIISALTIASLIALIYLLNGSLRKSTKYPIQSNIGCTVLFHKPCRTRLFTYHELELATEGFEASRKLATSSNGTIHSGILGDGTQVAVQKIQCENETDLFCVLSQVEVLFAVSHKNMAPIIGCCIDSCYAYTSFVVYEFSVNGTLEEHLHGRRVGTDWHKRLIITFQIANALAYLQYEVTPPIFHRNLKSGCIFLDQEFSVKIAGFNFRSCSNNSGESSNFHKSDVYDMGLILIEIIVGSSTHLDHLQVTLEKIKYGNMEEIVDLKLSYDEQSSIVKRQIEKVADIGRRCVLFGGDGKFGMVDVVRELGHVLKEGVYNGGSSKRGPSLEETFSNSSLLQMISMSPDSTYVP